MGSACATHFPFLSLKGLGPPGDPGSSTAGPCAVPWTCPFLTPSPGAKPRAPGKRNGGTHVYLTSFPEQGPRKPMEGQPECWPLPSSLGSHALLLLSKEGQQALQAGPCWKLSRTMEPGRRKGMLGSSTQRGERLPSPPRARLGTGQTAPAVLTPPPPPHLGGHRPDQGQLHRLPTPGLQAARGTLEPSPSPSGAGGGKSNRGCRRGTSGSSRSPVRACVCTHRPRGAARQRDTIQIVVLDPHEADTPVGQDGRQHPFLLLLHQDRHEVLHLRHVHVTAVIPADEHLGRAGRNTAFNVSPQARCLEWEGG